MVAIKDGLAAIQANIILGQKTEVIERLKEYLTNGSTKKGANTLWMDLIDAIEKRDIEKYRISMESLNRIQK